MLEKRSTKPRSAFRLLYAAVPLLTATAFAAVGPGCIGSPPAAGSDASTAPCTGESLLCGDTCVDPGSDGANCGSCGKACGDGEVCSLGTCATSCGGGATKCGSRCVDTSVDSANCGTCGKACEAGQVCSNGACSTTCNGGTTKCGSRCVDTSVDPANCGACGTTCEAGQVCSNGACSTTCSGGTTMCSSRCVATSVDPANCGACGTVCPSGVCTNGACAPVPRVTDIALGGEHTCSLHADGSVRCWGRNDEGQLGLGAPSTAVVTRPRLITNVGSATKLSAGGAHTCALYADGLRCWGFNYYGQLGNATSPANTAAPANAIALAFGPQTTFEAGGEAHYTSGTDTELHSASHTCAVTGGQLFCWGANTAGQLGVGNKMSANVPQNVGNSSSYKEVTAGKDHTCALSLQGKVSCWGGNGWGQLGTGQYADPNGRTTPSTWLDTVGGTTDLMASAISAGSYHTCAIPIDSYYNGIVCWGRRNTSGNWVRSDPHWYMREVSYDRSNPPMQLTSGADYTCTRFQNGSAECWGANDDGQLGVPDTATRNSTLSWLPTNTIEKIVAGSWHTCALLSNGEVKCWGSNSSGELGDGTTVSRATPQTVQF